MTAEPPIGPSLAKVALDLHLAAAARRQIAVRHYHLIYTHEEAAFIGARVARRCRVPHLYEMHSSLPEQMVNYGWFRPGGRALRLARRAERWLLGRCDAVIVVSPAMAETVRAARPGLPVVLIENVPLTYALGLTGEAPGTPIPGRILYAGNLARNQGVDMLLAAMQMVRQRVPGAHLVVIGGRPGEVARAEALARRLGLAGRVDFRGIRPPDETLAAHYAAQVLVSPREVGTNVPSKVYTYLSVGRPIVATAIAAHTQVLDEGCAILVSPTPAGLAAGIVRGLKDRGLADRLASAAAACLARRFDLAHYLDRLHRAVALAIEGGAGRLPAAR